MGGHEARDEHRGGERDGACDQQADSERLGEGRCGRVGEALRGARAGEIRAPSTS